MPVPISILKPFPAEIKRRKPMTCIKCHIKFLSGLESHLAEGRFQMTADGFHFYECGAQDVFCETVDFAQQIKLYGDYGQHDAAAKYSPGKIMEVISKIRDGRPDPEHISTSYVERSNLSLRMHLRRFTRLTNAFSKLDNLKAAVCLWFAYYNFCRVHQTLRGHSRDGSGAYRPRLESCLSYLGRHRISSYGRRRYP